MRRRNYRVIAFHRGLRAGWDGQVEDPTILDVVASPISVLRNAGASACLPPYFLCTDEYLATSSNNASILYQLLFLTPPLQPSIVLFNI